MTFALLNMLYNPRSQDAIESDDLQFLEWHKGGRMFHKLAGIDPTQIIDFGAVVKHSWSLVGGNGHVGSGAVIRPNVTIGRSTNIGYN